MIHQSRLLTATWILALLSQNVDAASELKQVHVITRHGARTQLKKDSDTLLENGGSTLTPLGQKQLYQLGQWLRSTYNNKGFLDIYDPNLVRLESSNLDRTLTSANSLSMGLFPLNAQAGNHGTEVYTSELPNMPSIPVYSRQERNDVYLQSYKQCPKFHSRLQDLYESPQWKTLETNHQGILNKLEGIFPDETEGNEAIGLKHIWNFYDQIHVVRTECGNDELSYACTSLPRPELASALSDSEFDQLENLVEQTEEMKFGQGTAGNLIGSNVLWEILTRATNNGRFFLYSAHAPLILGVLSAIQEWSQDERFVDYGSALIIEIFEDPSSNDVDDALTIRFLYKAASKNVARYLPLTHVNCDVDKLGLQHCSLTKFINWAAQNTLVTEEQWCQACENQFSDVCMEQLVGNAIDIKEDLKEMEQAVLNNPDTGAIIGSALGGFLAGLLFMALCCSCRSRKQSQNESTVDKNRTENVETEAEPSPEGGDEGIRAVPLT